MALSPCDDQLASTIAALPQQALIRINHGRSPPSKGSGPVDRPVLSKIKAGLPQGRRILFCPSLEAAMLITPCDCRPGPDRRPIASIGEIEGRLIVMEMVALGCLSCLHGIDASARKHALTAIRRCVRSALRNAKLSGEDVDAATVYAADLLAAAEKEIPRRGTGGKKLPKAKTAEKSKGGERLRA
jgi:hypothetical protein